jgi:hypothetical protein
MRNKLIAVLLLTCTTPAFPDPADCSGPIMSLKTERCLAKVRGTSDHKLCMSTADGRKSHTTGHCERAGKTGFTCHFPTAPLTEQCWSAGKCFVCQGED